MKKVILNTLAIILIISLISLLTLVVWGCYRGTQPMMVADARGITLWQFIRERWSTWEEANERVASLPGYAGCKNNITRFFSINVRSALNYVYACLFPGSKMADDFLYWEEKRPDPVLPEVEEIRWFEVPDTFWKYFESAYWRGLVAIDYRAGACSLGPVDYDAILGGSQ